MESTPWSAIVVTCQSENEARAVQLGRILNIPYIFSLTVSVVLVNRRGIISTCRSVISCLYFCVYSKNQALNISAFVFVLLSS